MVDGGNEKESKGYKENEEMDIEYVEAYTESEVKNDKNEVDNIKEKVKEIQDSVNEGQHKEGEVNDIKKEVKSEENEVNHLESEANDTKRKEKDTEVESIMNERQDIENEVNNVESKDVKSNMKSAESLERNIEADIEFKQEATETDIELKKSNVELIQYNTEIEGLNNAECIEQNKEAVNMNAEYVEQTEERNTKIEEHINDLVEDIQNVLVKSKSKMKLPIQPEVTNISNEEVDNKLNNEIQPDTIEDIIYKNNKEFSINKEQPLMVNTINDEILQETVNEDKLQAEDLYKGYDNYLETEINSYKDHFNPYTSSKEQLEVSLENNEEHPSIELVENSSSVKQELTLNEDVKSNINSQSMEVSARENHVLINSYSQAIKYISNTIKDKEVVIQDTAIESNVKEMNAKPINDLPKSKVINNNKEDTIKEAKPKVIH